MSSMLLLGTMEERLLLGTVCPPYCRCTFAVDGAGMTVNEEVERVLKEFHGNGKPIGLVKLTHISRDFLKCGLYV